LPSPSEAAVRRKCTADGGCFIGADAQLPTDSGDCAKITDELLAADAAAAAKLGNRVGPSRIIEIVLAVSAFSAPSHYSLCNTRLFFRNCPFRVIDVTFRKKIPITISLQTKRN